ncbi:hypothetical protein COCSADRAFT_38443 [Bipolaris sorokiniana ND90Pr]|uniref:Uncharacterized protein n=1 Tax=Cochliobolus sativus (strain ND90Pr / ATCC 201652) TaxID=665912 RepID=M2T0H7_COCSN|nr:uncharacterized protein COCSADRAFT_38443 [Bipolaris sorokiniana ND90Pr]EMD62527.1 hypothetical protein COCSADRAFT_38443 [Bipolaris sorokiniana ND90Pr]
MTHLSRISNASPQSNNHSHPLIQASPPTLSPHPFPSSSTNSYPCTPSPPITSRQSSTRSPHTHAGPPAHHLKTEDRPSLSLTPVIADPHCQPPPRPTQPKQAAPQVLENPPAACAHAQKRHARNPVSKHEEALRKEKAKKNHFRRSVFYGIVAVYTPPPW